MITAIIILVVVAGMATLVWPAQKKGSLSVKLALAATYLAIIAIGINTYSTGMTAEQQGTSGSSTGWLGDWWLPTLIILIVLAVLLHIALGRSRHAERPNS